MDAIPAPSSSDMIELCKKHMLFQEQSRRLLEELVSKMVALKIHDGDVVCRAGDFGTDMFVVYSGELACLTRENVEVKVLKAGDCFGELAAMALTTERALTIQAKCAAIIYRVRNSDFQVYRHGHKHHHRHGRGYGRRHGCGHRYRHGYRRRRRHRVDIGRDMPSSMEVAQRLSIERVLQDQPHGPVQTLCLHTHFLSLRIFRQESFSDRPDDYAKLCERIKQSALDNYKDNEMDRRLKDRLGIQDRGVFDPRARWQRGWESAASPISKFERSRDVELRSSRPVGQTLKSL